MRAMNNLVRMKIIEQTANKHAKKQYCSTQSFGMVDSVSFLPREMSGLPSKSILKRIYRCQMSDLQTEKEFIFEMQVDDPENWEY